MLHRYRIVCSAIALLLALTAVPVLMEVKPADAQASLRVADRATLKQLDPSRFEDVYLMEEGREGRFRRAQGSPPVNDPHEGVYVPSNTPRYHWQRANAAEINVRWFGARGDGTTDDTAKINAAIGIAAALGTSEVLVPPGVYMIEPVKAHIVMKSNVSLRLSTDTILMAIANDSQLYSVIYAYDVKNIKISGGTIIGDRTTHSGSGGEWGYGIALHGVANAEIADVEVKDFWGDGIIITDLDDKGTSPCTDIHVRRVYSHNNRRQGLSAIHWIGGSITDSFFANTNGTSPQFGIDFEPDKVPIQQVSGILVRNNLLLHNAGGGIGLVQNTVRNNIFSKNVIFGDAKFGMIFINAAKDNKFQDNIIIAPNQAPAGVFTMNGAENSFERTKFLGQWQKVPRITSR